MNEISLEKVVDLLKNGIPSTTASSGLSPFDIDSKQFEEFAILDSQNDSIQGRVNTLSNIKRAIECRIDELLYNLCLYVKSKDENWNFPKKIEVLKDLEIIAPRILTKINRQRNLLEHEYVNPSKDDIADALDVTVLFIGYTDRFMNFYISELSGGDIWKIIFNRENDAIEVKIDNDHMVVSIDSSDKWLEIAKLLVKNYTSIF